MRYRMLTEMRTAPSPCLSMAAGDLNSGSHECAASSLHTEISPQP